MIKAGVFEDSNAFTKANAQRGTWVTVDSKEWPLFGRPTYDLAPRCDHLKLDDEWRLLAALGFQDLPPDELLIKVCDYNTPMPVVIRTMRKSDRCGTGRGARPEVGSRGLNFPVDPYPVSKRDIKVLAGIVCRAIRPDPTEVSPWLRPIVAAPDSLWVDTAWGQWRYRLQLLRRLLLAKFVRKRVDEIIGLVLDEASKTYWNKQDPDYADRAVAPRKDKPKASPTPLPCRDPIFPWPSKPPPELEDRQVSRIESRTGRSPGAVTLDTARTHGCGRPGFPRILRWTALLRTRSRFFGGSSHPTSPTLMWIRMA